MTINYLTSNIHQQFIRKYGSNLGLCLNQLDPDKRVSIETKYAELEAQGRITADAPDFDPLTADWSDLNAVLDSPISLEDAMEDMHHDMRLALIEAYFTNMSEAAYLGTLEAIGMTCDAKLQICDGISFPGSEIETLWYRYHKEA